MSKREVRLSQTMIVKNEEKDIERALSWGKDICWEQIVVDTGSTDRTVELAQKMGAKVVHFEWCDDFAKAKNFAMDQCSGDWIAILDADEYFTKEDAWKLHKILQQADKTNANAISCSWMQLNDENKIYTGGTVMRIFRNDPKLRYARRIHENVEGTPDHPLIVMDKNQELSILHTGYQTEAIGRKKTGERNRNIILKELEDHPNDCDMLGYLGDAYRSMGDWENAEKAYREAVKYIPKNVTQISQRCSLTLTYLLSIDANKKDNEAILVEDYEKAVSIMHEESDFEYLMGCYYYAYHKWAKAAEFYLKALQKMEQYGIMYRAMQLQANLKIAYENLAYAFLMSGDDKNASKYAASMLQADKYDYFSLTTLLSAYKHMTEKGLVSQAQVNATMPQLYDSTLLMDKLLIYRASIDIGYKPLKEFVWELFTEIEQTQLEEIENNVFN